MRNPFYNRGPITDPKFFFPRPRETRDIMRLLAGSQNCSLVGPVKSGKTSTLLHLARPGTLALHGLSPTQHSAVYLSFEGLGSLSPEQFFHVMLRETARRAAGKMAVVWPRFEARDAISFLDLKEVLDQIEVAGERLIFLLDEVELASSNPAFDLNFSSALRNIASRPGVCFVTATGCLLHEVEIAGRDIGSPFADLFSVVRLRPLDPDVAWKSIASLASAEGVDLTPERDLIGELGGCCPFALQLACYEVFELKSGSDPLEEPACQYVRSRAYEQYESVLSMAWARMVEAEREAALAALRGSGPGVKGEGMILSGDGDGRPANAMAARFLEKRGRDCSARAEEYLAEEPGEPDQAVMYGVVRILMRAVEARDRYARGHADRVARLAAAVSKEMGCPDDMTDGVRVAARLHDVGRISISDMIILKPGPLSELEREIMCTHPLVGAQILDALEFPWSVKPAVRYHHERLDGSGYPEGLMGEEIPLAARIVAVADVMAAMTADRPYRQAGSEEEALAELTANVGTKYDPAVVAALERVVARGPA
jgi:putative nucleotidyltransferase with HDIG domain